MDLNSQTVSLRAKMTIYLVPEQDVKADNLLYYISLYFPQDGENISYIQPEADDTIKYASKRDDV